MKNKLTDLRNHLFETLEGLKDKDQPMDVARAKAVGEIAQVLINSAKVEIQFLEAIDSSKASSFFADERPALRLANDGHK